MPLNVYDSYEQLNMYAKVSVKIEELEWQGKTFMSLLV